MSAKVSHDSETPAYGKQVITACAFIHDVVDGEIKVFRAKRAESKKFLPGLFELPGGHIDFGENIVEGLKREVLEETGMHISVGDAFYAFDYINEIKGSHFLEIVFFAKFLDPIENIKLEPEDHSEWRWMNEEDVRRFPTTDSELAAVLRGFALLKTGKLNLG
jgi:8-oxo-dGTP diphosphatase